MHFLTAFFALPLLALAAPQATAPAPSNGTEPETNQPSELKIIQRFYLRSADASNQPEHFNNLYLVASHTGAGLSDAVFAAEKYPGWAAFLNGTHVQFNLNPYTPWGLLMENQGYMYASWNAVTINAAKEGYGNGGFFFNETGLQWEAYQFGGWMACDWAHDEPQLFYYFRMSGHTRVIPSNCAFINLKPEYIS